MKRPHHPDSKRSLHMTARPLLAALMLLAAAAMAHADDLAMPAGPVLLTLSGKLERTNREGAAVFDAAMLAALPRHRVETSTPWTDGKKMFEGVLLADLLDLVGAQDAQTLRATALNEYEIAIPASDAAEFGVLLAMSMDGKPLSRRDKGPIWIVYPRDGISRIQDERYDARWVWQLSKIEVR